MPGRPSPPGLLWTAALLVALASCAQEPREIVLSGPTMGTTWNLKVVPGPAGPGPDAVRQLVTDALGEVDAVMSTYRPDSAVSRFNASASSDWIAVPESLAAVVAEMNDPFRRSPTPDNLDPFERGPEITEIR